MSRIKARQDRSPGGFGDLAGADLFADATITSDFNNVEPDDISGSGEILSSLPIVAPTAQPSSTTNKSVPHFHNHRWRLRERFLSAGPGSLADY